jgi:hypothetical protein
MGCSGRPSWRFRRQAEEIRGGGLADRLARCARRHRRVHLRHGCECAYRRYSCRGSGWPDRRPRRGIRRPPRRRIRRRNSVRRDPRGCPAAVRRRHARRRPTRKFRPGWWLRRKCRHRPRACHGARRHHLTLVGRGGGRSGGGGLHPFHPHRRDVGRRMERKRRLADSPQFKAYLEAGTSISSSRPAVSEAAGSRARVVRGNRNRSLGHSQLLLEHSRRCHPVRPDEGERLTGISQESGLTLT